MLPESGRSGKLLVRESAKYGSGFSLIRRDKSVFVCAYAETSCKGRDSAHDAVFGGVVVFYIQNGLYACRGGVVLLNCG